MKQKINKILSIILPLTLGVFLVYYAYNQFKPEEIELIKSHFIHADYSFIALSSFFSFISLVSRGYRWKYSLEHMGYKTQFYNNIMAVCIGYLMNLTIPRSGEVSRALVLKKYNDIPFDKSFGSIIAERVVDLVLLLLFVSIACLLQFEHLKTFLMETIPFEKLLLLGGVGILGLLVFVYFFFYSKNTLVLKIKNKISGLVEGVSSIFQMKNRKEFLFFTACIWISYVLTFYFGMKTIEETSHLPFGVMMCAFVVGSLAVTFTNGGFGAFPFMIAQVLLLFGIAQTAGTAAGWILWSSQTGMVVVFGGLSFLLLPLFNKTKNY